ncbi:hypothetical protein D3C78_1288340 [compost metagenome]
MVGPRDFQFVDVGAIDLIQRGEAAATFGITVVRPVLLRLVRLDRGQARASAGGGNGRVRDEHVARRDRQTNRQHSGNAVGTATWNTTAGTLEQWVDQRDRQANGAEHEQAREHWPEHQPGIAHCPNRCSNQKRGKQPGTGWLVARDQQTGNGHDQATHQEVPRASQADQLHAARSQRQAEQGDDDAQPDQNEF